jgi:hypothetical protein
MIGLAAMFVSLSFRLQQQDPLTLIGCAIPWGVGGGEPSYSNWRSLILKVSVEPAREALGPRSTKSGLPGQPCRRAELPGGGVASSTITLRISSRRDGDVSQTFGGEASLGAPTWRSSGLNSGSRSGPSV